MSQRFEAEQPEALRDPFGNLVLALLCGVVPISYALLMMGLVLVTPGSGSGLLAQAGIACAFGLVGVGGVAVTRSALGRKVISSREGITLKRTMGTKTIAWGDIRGFEVTVLDAEAARYLSARVRLHKDSLAGLPSVGLPFGPFMGVTARGGTLRSHVARLNAELASIQDPDGIQPQTAPEIVRLVTWSHDRLQGSFGQLSHVRALLEAAGQAEIAKRVEAAAGAVYMAQLEVVALGPEVGVDLDPNTPEPPKDGYRIYRKKNELLARNILNVTQKDLSNPPFWLRSYGATDAAQVAEDARQAVRAIWLDLKSQLPRWW